MNANISPPPKVSKHCTVQFCTLTLLGLRRGLLVKFCLHFWIEVWVDVLASQWFSSVKHFGWLYVMSIASLIPIFWSISQSQSVPTPPHLTPPHISLGTSYSENYRTLYACKVRDIICIGDDNSPYRTYLSTFHNTPLTVYIEIRFHGGLLIN